jgi:hypothetical protein
MSTAVLFIGTVLKEWLRRRDRTVNLKLGTKAVNLEYPIGRMTAEERAQLIAALQRHPVDSPTEPVQTLADRIDAALAEVTVGRFAYNPPGEMRQGKTERVTVAIVRSRDLDKELRTALVGSGIAQFADIRTSPLMSVQLRGEPAFATKPLSELEQPVNKSEVTVWEFDVRAIRPGNQILTAIVAMRVPVEGHEDVRRSLPALERSVRIRVSPAYAAGQFARSNWQWMVATGVAIGGGVATWVKLLH